MEHESFWTLFKSASHWEFELFLMLLFDVVIGAVLWPFIRRHLKQHKEHAEICQVPDDTRSETDQTCTRRKPGGWICGKTYSEHYGFQTPLGACLLFTGQDGIARDANDSPPPKMSRR